MEAEEEGVQDLVEFQEDRRQHKARRELLDQGILRY